jgi:hypothetical protein
MPKQRQGPEYACSRRQARQGQGVLNLWQDSQGTVLGRPTQCTPEAGCLEIRQDRRRGERGSSGKQQQCTCRTYFPKDINLLQDANVFIADTGSTCHSTKYDLGLTNLRKADETHTVTMANGSKESSSNKEGQSVSSNHEGCDLSTWRSLQPVQLFPTSTRGMANDGQQGVNQDDKRQ